MAIDAPLTVHDEKASSVVDCSAVDCNCRLISDDDDDERALNDSEPVLEIALAAINRPKYGPLSDVFRDALPCLTEE